MTEVYRRRPAPGDWPRPDGLVQREVDITSGMLPNPWCPQESIRSEWFIPGTEPVGQCTVHTPFEAPLDSTNPFAIPNAPLPVPGTATTAPTPGATIFAPGNARVTPGSAPVPQRTPPRPAPPAPPAPRDTTNPFRIP